MQRIISSIKDKPQWDFLQPKIDSIVRHSKTNQNDAIGKIKDLIETIGINIIVDNGGQDEKKEIGPLTKDVIRTLSFYGHIETRDQDVAIKLTSAFISAFTSIGELRNRHGTVGHGQDVDQHDIDQYLFEMASECADALGAFLIKAHHCDLHQRYRLRFEDNSDFNDYLDNAFDDVQIADVMIAPSRALFTDIEAYKEQLQSFRDSPDALTETLTITDNIEQTVGRINQISSLFNSSQIKSLKQLAEQQARIQTQLEPLLNSIDFQHLTRTAESMQPVIDAAIAAKVRQEHVKKRLGL